MRTPLPALRSAAPTVALVLGAVAILAAGCSSAGRAAAPPTAASTTAGPTAPAPGTGAATTTPAASGAPAGHGDPPPAASGSWTTYQNSAAHLGVAAGAGPTPPLRPAWSAPLDGAAVYGQPLEYAGRVIVATEADDLFGLDAATGAVRWEVHLGAPLRHVGAIAGCGDIDPLGITSTPVVDPATGTVYAVGETSAAGAAPVHFTMVAVQAATGRVERRLTVDPPLPAGEDPVHLLQRAALALGPGRVYVAFGGQYGDCGTYHGWVVGVPTGSPTTGPAGGGGGPGARTAFDVTPTATGGAIWNAGSGPAVGADGSVYVTTGNPNGGGPAPWAEAVLRLAPDLATPPEAVFQDRAAYADLDLATAGPVLLPDGTVFAAGKTDIAYLLSGSGLEQVAFSGRVCGSDPDGGAAFDAALDSLYVPCQDGGIQQVRLAARTMGWHSGGANSTVVLAGGALWSLDYDAPAVQELDPAGGRSLYRLPLAARLPHFASLSVAGGLVLVPTRTGVLALRGA